MKNNIKIDLDSNIKLINQKNIEMIEYIFYFTEIRPNIIFIMYLCAKFQSNMKESHMIMGWNILKFALRVRTQFSLRTSIYNVDMM